jgi:hypothetical protein
MNPLNASQSTVCGLAWKRYSRQTLLRDVAPAPNGRASLAGAGHAERALQASGGLEEINKQEKTTTFVCVSRGSSENDKRTGLFIGLKIALSTPGGKL